jgi:membrane protease YdiL (CAAX protease family)
VSPKDYLARSRSPRYSLLFALPLLLLYEGLSFALTGSAVEGVRNGADVLLKSLFLSLGGRDGLIAFNLLLFGAGGVLVWRDARRAKEPLLGGVFAAMLGESVAYAALFGIVVGWLTALVLAGPRALQIGAGAITLPTQLVISLGAGIYEELLFRVLLVGGLLAAFKALFGWRPWLAASVAVLVSSLIFSGFHYVGSLGDTFSVSSFTFRAIAGIVFSVLYVRRGFGITAWTHALYDLGLSLIQAAGTSHQ